MIISVISIFADNDRLPEMLKTLRCWQQEKTLVDFTITTSDHQSFSVHKFYMACWSDYMKTLLTGTLPDSKADSVKLENIQAQVGKLVHWSVTG